MVGSRVRSGSSTRLAARCGLGWRLAQVGTAMDWRCRAWRSPAPPLRTVESHHLRELLAVTRFALVMLALQTPRADRVVFAYLGASAPIRSDDGRISRRLRTAADRGDRAQGQSRALADLDPIDLATWPPAPAAKHSRPRAASRSRGCRKTSSTSPRRTSWPGAESRAGRTV